MELRTVYLTPSISAPLSSPSCAPLGAPVTEATAIVLDDGTTYLLARAEPVTLDADPLCETHRRVREEIAKALPTRGEREAAGMLTDEDRAEMATESAEQAAAAAAAWEAEKRARESPGAKAKREAREKGSGR